MRKASNATNYKPKKRKKISMFQIVILGLFVYFAYTVYDQQIQINSYNSKIETYKADIENKNKLIEYYDEQKDSIETTEYIEDVARESLGYVKPYEKIFVDANK